MISFLYFLGVIIWANDCCYLQFFEITFLGSCVEIDCVYLLLPHVYLRNALRGENFISLAADFIDGPWHCCRWKPSDSIKSFPPEAML